MVVDDLDVLGARVCPSKAHTELVVHADTVLSGAIARERLQPISGRHTKVFQLDRDLELSHLAACDRLDVHKPLNPSTARESLRIGALERYDHEKSITYCVINVKRDGLSDRRLQDLSAVPINER